MFRTKLALAIAALAVWSAPLPLGAQGVPTCYQITAVDYQIEGKTREGPLSDRLEIKIGMKFQDIVSLEAYIEDKRQVLANERVLESSDILLVQGEMKEGIVPVTLVVKARDTWNLIILPYPKYTTNDGLLLSLRIRNYNFLGSMENLNVDLDYRFDENKNSSFGVGVSFDLPFVMADLDWAIATSQVFAYNFSGRLTYTSKNTLRLYLEGERFLWTVRAGQHLFWNEDGDLDTDLDKVVLQTLGGISTEVDLFRLGDLGFLTLTPDLEIGSKYLAEGGTISEDRRGAYVSASYTFKTGRADWIENLRRGTVLSVQNAFSYNFHSESWGITVTTQARHYEAWNNRIGLNSRLTVYGSLLGISEGIGGYIRGIPDTNIDGDYAAFVNLDLPIRLFDFKPSLLIKKDWLDFEAHAAPFVDAALVRNGEGADFEPYLCGGLELFGFLKRSRSIYARLSLGVNALGYFEDRSLSGNYELFFGLGHDY